MEKKILPLSIIVSQLQVESRTLLSRCLFVAARGPAVSRSPRSERPTKPSGQIPNICDNTRQPPGSRDGFLLWAMWATTQGAIYVRPPKNKTELASFIDHFHFELVEWVLSCLYCHINLLLRVMYTGCVCVRRGRGDPRLHNTNCVQINSISFIKLK